MRSHHQEWLAVPPSPQWRPHPYSCAPPLLRPLLQAHTVPTKTTGHCGSVSMRLIPAPRGAGIVAARTPKKARRQQLLVVIAAFCVDQLQP